MVNDAKPVATGTWRDRLTRHLQAAWQHRGLTACLLWPLSLIYRVLLALRRLAYLQGWKPRHRLPVPVLVVGNVVVGGTGKTPTVIALVKQLEAWGWRPGIISRGHGRSGDDCRQVTSTSKGDDVGDEPLLLARATAVPLVVGRDRPAAGRLLLELHPEVNLIVSDDGMQHWGLERDITLVLFDQRGTGNGWLLPAGLLREPWPAQAWDNGPLIEFQTGPSRHLSNFAHNALGHQRPLQHWTQCSPRVGAFAGIAQPEAFFVMLRLQGIQPCLALPLPDHADAATLLKTLQTQPASLDWLCTEKDAVKLFPLLSKEWAQRVWAVPLEQPLPADLLSTLKTALDGLSSRHGRQTT